MESAELEDWLLPLLRCPACGKALSSDGDDLACPCGARYPVLAGVPICVVDPARWVSRHREAVVTAIAEVGALTDEEMERIERWAMWPREEPTRFGDDWTVAEARGHEPPAPLDEDLAEWTRRHDLPGRVESEVGEVDYALELGVGAGEVAERLSQQCHYLVVVDLSLRAVLTALWRTGSSVVGVVADAANLPLADESFAAVVARNVIDLVDAPDRVLAESARVMKGPGRLIMTTPDPALGSSDDDLLFQVIEDSGFRIVGREDVLPWVRAHSARELQIFLVALAVAELDDAGT